MAYPPGDPRASLGLLVKVYPKLSETFILEEILGLERMGVDLRLYSLAPSRDSFTHAAVARVRAPHRRVPAVQAGWLMSFCRRHLGLLTRSPRRYLKSLVAALASGNGLAFMQAGWLAGQLLDDGVTHLHAHFISETADVAELVAAMTGLPFSISAHAKDIYLSDAGDLRRKLRAATFTVTCTEFNRRTLAELAPETTVHRMYHGIDQAVFTPSRRARSEGPPIILSVGRLREKKGLDTLIAACAWLRDMERPFRCEIVGYGDQAERLEAQIDRLGLTSDVRLLGKLSREQVIDCYARASVYVQPSRIAADGDRDGIPNVLLEAMAMSLPVVASSVSGIPELVEHQVNGLLVPPDDPEALALAIQDVLNDPARCSAMGVRARETVARDFDNDLNLQLLCRLLQESGGGCTSPARPAPMLGSMGLFVPGDER